MMMKAGDDDGMNKLDRHLGFIEYTLEQWSALPLVVSLLMSLDMRMQTHLYVRYGPCPLTCSVPGLLLVEVC